MNQNEHCEKCVEEGFCIDGILFNKAGTFKFNVYKLILIPEVIGDLINYKKL